MATPAASGMKPVHEAAAAGVGETLREHGLAAPVVGGGTTIMRAKTANEVLKVQDRRILLQKLKGEVMDRVRSKTLMFRLAHEEIRRANLGEVAEIIAIAHRQDLKTRARIPAYFDQLPRE